MQLTWTACLQDPANLPVIEEGQQFFGGLPQDMNFFGFDLDYHEDSATSVAITERSISPHSRTNEETIRDHFMIGGDPFILQQEQPLNRSKKPRFQCSETGCPKDFSSENEFSKHLTGDHDKDAIFACKHDACPLHPFKTSREEMWKRHHSDRHRGCPVHEACMEETRTRERRFWACGICEDLFTNAKAYAKHYKSHISEGKFHQADNDFSTILRSLLRQEATRDKWDGRSVDIRDIDGTFHLSWETKTCSHIREAMEYGTYNGSSLTNPEVVDLLLDELTTLARPRWKRHASSRPVTEEREAAPSRSFRDRVLSKSDWQQQIRADTVSALPANFDPYDTEL